MADRYVELLRHAALIQPSAADALLDHIEQSAQLQWPGDDGIARAAECGQLRGTVRNLIAHIERLHDELRHCAVHGACNGWIDENGRRLREVFGIDIEAEHAALETGDEPEPEPEPEEDEAEVVAGLNAEFVADQMRGMRRAA